MFTVNGVSVRIIFIDRSSDLREVYQHLFEEFGCIVESVPTGEEALALAETFQPHAIYTSLVLDGMDGCELARQVRELDTTPRAMLVAMTGYSGRSIEQDCLKAGFDRHLPKPAGLYKLLLPLASIPGITADRKHSALRPESRISDDCAYAAFRRAILGGI